MKFTCTKCNKEFSVGQWDCFPGEKHEVEQKTYHIGNTCADVADRIKSQLRVYVTSDRESTDANGTTNFTPARFVTFYGGLFTTTDPEDQFFMESKYKKVLISPEEWEKTYIHPKELLAKKEREMNNRQQRMEREEQDLRDRVKRLKEEEAVLSKKQKVGA